MGGEIGKAEGEKWQGRTTTRGKLNKTFVAGLEIESSTYEAWDLEIPGFGVRVSPKGKKSFFLKYYFRGKQQRVSLGVFGEITAEQARELARARRGDASSGTNPAARKRELKKAKTVAELVTEFGEKYCDAHLAPTSARDYKSLLKRWLVPELGTMLVADVKKSQVVQVFQAHADQPTQANRFIAYVRKMMYYAEDMGYRPENSNPALRVKLNDETQRQTCLDANTLAVVGRVFRELEATEGPSVDCLRVILLTGARKSEIRRLQWSQVRDVPGSESIVLTEHKTKRAIGAKIIPLSAPALAIIRRQPKELKDVPNLYVFQGKRKDCLCDPWKLWDRRVRPMAKETKDAEGRPQAHADLDGVTVHDLRHTFGSIAVGEADVDALVLKDLLGHVDVSTTQRYTHNRIQTLKTAADATAAVIARQMEGA